MEIQTTIIKEGNRTQKASTAQAEIYKQTLQMLAHNIPLLQQIAKKFLEVNKQERYAYAYPCEVIATNDLKDSFKSTMRHDAIGITTNNGWQFTIAIKKITFARWMEISFETFVVGTPAEIGFAREAVLSLPFEYNVPLV
jgi:hypothetical protein